MSETDQSTAASHTPATGYDAGRRWFKILPEVSTAVLVLVLWVGWAPDWMSVQLHEALYFLVAAEGATLLLMCTLVDVATRLKRAPPIWLGVLIVVGLLAVYPQVFTLLQMSWELGMATFVALSWSMLERFRELWTLPNAGRIEKFRRRALTFGRLHTGLIAAGVLTVGMLIGVALDENHEFPDALETVLLASCAIAFFLIAAFDAWRVHRPAFAKSPRQLWSRTGRCDVSDLSPL